MADPGVNSHDPPLCGHKVVFVEDDSRMLAKQGLLSNGFQVSGTDGDTTSLHSPQYNALPSVTSITDSQDDDDRSHAEEDEMASGFELSDESDSGADARSHDNANTVAAAQSRPTSSKRIPVDKYFTVEAEVEKNHQIEDGLQDHRAPEPQDVVAAPEQLNSAKPEHGVFTAKIPSSSNDLRAVEEDYLTEMVRKLGNQRVDELPLVGDHKSAKGAKKANPPVANHEYCIATDFSRLAQENRAKYDPTLDGLDFICGNEYRFTSKKQLAAGKDGESSSGSDGFLASRGGQTRTRGRSPLRGGRTNGHIRSPMSRSDLGLGRRLSFHVAETFPPQPPPTDPKLAEALALARSMKFNPAEGKSSRGRPSAIHSSIERSVGTTWASFVAAKTRAPSPKKATKRSRQSSFNKDTSARLVLKSAVAKTTFNNDWLSNASSALATKSASRPSGKRPNSAPHLSDVAHQTSAVSVTRGSSDGADLLVQRAYSAPLPSLPSTQDWEDEHGPDNIYDAPHLQPAQLISLSPVRSAAFKGALLDLREIQDEDNLDWMSMPVFQPGLPPTEAATSDQPVAGGEDVDYRDDSNLLMDFGFPSRVADQSSEFPSYFRHGSISGSTMPMSLMDQAMNEGLPDSHGVGETVESTVAVTDVISTNGRTRYGRCELISMRHKTPPDLVVSIVDNIPAEFHSWSLRLRTQSRSSSVVPPKPPQPQADVATAALVELQVEVRKTLGLGGLGDSKWASPEKTTSTAQPPATHTEVAIGSIVEVVGEVKTPSDLGGLTRDSTRTSLEDATSIADKPQVKKYTGTGDENVLVLGDVFKTKKLGGLADSKYASPEKRSSEKPTHVSSRGAGQSASNRPRPPPRQCPAPSGSNGRNVERGRPRVVDENISPFPSRRRKRGGFGMDGGDDQSPKSCRRRRSLSRLPFKSPSRSVKNVDNEVQGAAADAFVAPAAVSPARALLEESTNLHDHRVGAVSIPVAEFGQMRSVAATAPFLPPPPPPVPAIPAVLVPNSPQPLLLQGHAFITGTRGEVRRVRCGVRGSPWHDRATNTVMAKIIVCDRIGRETEMVGALHGLPYDLQGNRWHADLFQAVEDLENEEDAAPIGPPCIDPDLEYSSQPVAAIYSWQSGLEEPSLPRFVPGPKDHFGSPPMSIHPSVVPPSYPHSSPDLPHSYIYPVPPPAANNLAHFHPVIDRSQAVRAPRGAFLGLVNSLSGATLVAPVCPPANAERRYTFGTPLVPNFQNHPGYQNPQVQTQDNANQQLFNHFVAQAQQPNPPQREVGHYFTEFQSLQVRTQGNTNQELFDHYVAQAQQPSAAQRSLQLLAQQIGPPVQFALCRPNVPGARSPHLPDGPPAPGTIFGNVPNSLSGRPDLGPEDAFDYQPPTPRDLAHGSYFEGFDGVHRRFPRANAAIPIVDPNAPSACRPAIRGILKRGREDEEATKRCGGEEEKE